MQLNILAVQVHLIIGSKYKLQYTNSQLTNLANLTKDLNKTLMKLHTTFLSHKSCTSQCYRDRSPEQYETN